MTFKVKLLISPIFKQILNKYFLFLFFFIFCTALSVDSKIFFLEADYYQDKTQEKKIILGKGEIISSDKTISRAAVSDPSIADLQVLNEKQIFVRAKQLGASTIIIWEKGKSNPSRFDISVWPDITYLTKQLQDLDKNITVDFIPPTTSLNSGGGGQAAQTASAPPPGGAANTAQPQGSGPQLTTGKIILKGEVDNAETIARALQLAGAYVGDQGIKIISQAGGQIVDGLSGKYDIHNNSDSQNSGSSAQGSATAFGARDPLSFTSNRYANLSRGVIATTQRGSVLSFLTVKDSAQISVAIRFYEISRSLARNLGFNATLGGSTLQGASLVGGNGISKIIGGIASIANLSGFMGGTGSAGADFSLAHGSVAGGSFLGQEIGQGVTGVIFNPDNGIGAIIQALQERGEIKTLAEPTLVIANGEPASFLAGGEVPIVRSVFTAGGASQDVAYEPFGIKFSLLPTITRNNRIHLQLIPEIRDIDTDLSNLVVPPGSTSVRPPAFRTKRTQTQVELESGQLFAISGLIREDNTRNLRKVPGIGDIPILGSLFRSKSFRKGESELLIVVSPQLVKPQDSNKIAKLSKPEPPYKDFNELAPLKPNFDLKKGDEEGPNINKPLDNSRHNEKATPELKSQTINKEEKTTFIKPEKDLKIQPLQEISKRLKENEKLAKRKQKEFQKKLDYQLKLAREQERAQIQEANKKINLAREKENIIKSTKEEESEKYQAILKEIWEKETLRYTQAKEAMKKARTLSY